MKKILLFSFLTLNIAPGALLAATWYVRPDGGTRYSSNVTTGLCDGTADATPVGTTPNQHCAFKDVRMLYQDGTYVVLPGSTFPAWGWVGHGGDTYIIKGSVGDGVSYKIGWNDLSSYCDSTGCWGVAGQPQSSGMLAPPSGTAGAHTKIYGSCMLTNSCDASKLSTLTELYGYGVDNVMSLYGASYVDVAGFSITDHSNCGFATDVFPCKTNGITLSPYAKNGIQLFNTTTHTTLSHIRVHGIAANGMIGAVGDGFVATDLQLIGNAASGWNADDGSGTTGEGSLLVQNFNISWNGCVEEYPMVDPLPYFSCTDQSSGGYGDGFGTASTDSLPPGWQVHFDNGIVSYNTQDGLDALHIGGVGSTMTDTRVLAFGNEGNQLKVGGATASIQNSVIIGSCEAMTTQAIPGTPVGFGSLLASPCRAGNTAVVILVTPGDPATFQDNTVYEAGAIGLEVEYATGDQGPTNTLKYDDNIFMGFFNIGSGSNATSIFSTSNLNMLTNPGASWSNNVTFGQRVNWTCPAPGESNAICTDPGLFDETYHPYGYGNMAPASSTSAVIGSGVAIAGIAIDITGASRATQPSIGALELGSVLGLPPTFPPSPPPTTVAAANQPNMRVYPNPWRKDKHAGHPITFDQMTAGSDVKIFTVSGHKVKDLDGSSGSVTWDLKNDSGDLVASGIYLYLIKDSQGNKIHGKVAIVQ